MATAVVEVCSLEDVLDPGGAIDHDGFQAKAVPADGLCAFEPSQIQTTFYEDTAMCSIQASLHEQDPFFSEEECKEPFIDEPAAPEDSPYVCEWTMTRIRLPSQPFESTRDGHQEHFLCLPVHSSASLSKHEVESSPHEESKGYVDESTDVPNQLRLAALNKYLASVPNLSHHYLFNNEGSSCKFNGSLHRLVTGKNSGRVINVLQGEIAHCTPSQADVLVSDDATTCHIVALRSIRRNSLGKDAVLATMTHVDGTGYDSCLRNAVMEHVKYHSKSYQVDPVRKENTSNRFHDNIDISIHIMGGFNDLEGSSIQITEHILQVFSRLAQEFDEFAHPPIAFNSLYHAAEKYWERRPRISMNLETCVVCEANDNGTGCPVGRGLGLSVASGEVFLAEVKDSGVNSSVNVFNDAKSDLLALDGDIHLVRNQPQVFEGPDLLLRSVRLWAAAFHPLKQVQKLTVIHLPDQDCLTIEPFLFGPNPSAKFVCYMDDARLLHMTSTSPLVEKKNFASKVRESLKYMNQTSSSNTFEIIDGVYQPIEYKRVGLNGWVLSKKHV